MSGSTPELLPGDTSGSTTAAVTSASLGHETARKKSRAVRIAQIIALRYGMVVILVALAIVARVAYDGFFDPRNLNNLVNQMTPITIIAIGSTFVIIAGGFDLSVGAVFAGATVSFATLSNSMPIWPAFILTLVLGVLAGLFNGLLIVIFKINTFIATLGSAALFTGIAYAFATNAQVIPENPDFSLLGLTKWGPFWASTYLLVFIIVVAGIVLHQTTFGNAVFAVGGNPEAARLAGIRTGAVVTGTFVIAAVCSALAGMLTASQSGVGQVNIGGGIALDAIAIVIVGGTSLLGGEGAIWRTVVGAFVFAIITNVLQSQGVSLSSQLIVKGGILIFAVMLDTLARRTRV